MTHKDLLREVCVKLEEALELLDQMDDPENEDVVEPLRTQVEAAQVSAQRELNILLVNELVGE